MRLSTGAALCQAATAWVGLHRDNRGRAKMGHAGKCSSSYSCAGHLPGRSVWQCTDRAVLAVGPYQLVWGCPPPASTVWQGLPCNVPLFWMEVGRPAAGWGAERACPALPCLQRCWAHGREALQPQT